MSFQAMAWAVALKLPTRDKFVLVMMANYADEVGKCWPSLNRLSDDTGMSRSTVQLAIKALADAGLLRIEQRTQDGVSLPNHYFLNLGAVYREPVHGADDETTVYRQPVGGVPVIGNKPINEPIREPIKDSIGQAFERFWSVYPRKIAKGAAERAWDKAARVTPPDAIIAAVEAAVWPADPQFIPHAATWLNQKRWLDEAPARTLTLAEQYALKAVLLADDETALDETLLTYREQ